jgi:hypothetical protein
MLITAYRDGLKVSFYIAFFTLSISFILLSSSQVSFAQTSSSPEIPLTQEGANNSQLAELQAAKQQYLAVWNNTAFTSQFDVFVAEGSHSGYGIYREHVPANVFRPGETIVLYMEPVAFGYQPVTDEDNVNNTATLYRINMTADYIISDSAGTVLATIEDIPAGEIISHNKNTEFSLTLTLSQEEPFPVGDYMITYVVHDQATGQSFQLDRQITIDDTAFTGSSSLPTDDESIQTVPPEQSQRQQSPGQVFQ